MNRINPLPKIRHPSLTLYAFHLHHDINQTVKADAPHLWEKFEQLAPLLQIPEIQALRHKLICYQNGQYDPNAEDKQLGGNLSLLRPDEDSYFPSVRQSDGLELRVMVDPYRINDTYAADLTLFYENDLTINQISRLNPQGCLLPGNIQASLGQTMIFFAEIVGDVENYQVLADQCIAQLLQGENLLKLIGKSRLFGSPIFEYDTPDANIEPIQKCHILVWFGKEKILEKAQQVNWINLLCCRHKIIYIYHQSRYCYDQAHKYYKDLDDIRDQLGDKEAKSIEQLEKWQADLTQMELRYMGYWRDIKDHQTAIAANVVNYRQLLNIIPAWQGDDRKFLDDFLAWSQTKYQQQIEFYLRFLEPGRELFAGASATLREQVKFKRQKASTFNLVILILGNGDFEKGFSSVIAQIWTDGERLPTQHTGQLPLAPELVKAYHRWQSLYKVFINDRIAIRLDKEKPQVTNFSIMDVNKLAEDLEEELNKWLNTEQFIPVDRILREKFMRSDQIQVIIQSDNIDVRRLPWHLWDFFKPYRKAEVALSLPFYDRPLKTAPTRNQIRILSILGDDKGIDTEKDKQLLAQIDAETAFIVKPNRQQLDEQLWSEQGWDILCFSGHSSSEMDGSNGYIKINDTDKLTIPELKNALRTAIERGLQIAIFNSCDGLGLANQLASLHIPQIIVMREPVPDVVAQEFLKNFLTAFASGKSFYLAVREAREKLQGLENYFPCASWLPVICQNPAEIPPIWDSLRRIS
ncbi:CHAT domain-containing protein [Aerosakkonemataceae cyanobacterium BLCC-F50]|uniref:CHAT domain-containing protein n=1 Tax=Floridaenema flaviceps BLCC-F50 TaxID=3153642 RepID=A0ABV4XIR3_9CYAN